ncbi:MAG: V-type ATP synthase subunit I [Paraprevotella sp.]|nr:V-type ATP synthase subunit I [Paraprevotella sp.]MDD6824308.1 V-type ATP synthase subunit I [Paraprevotella sp.]MDY3098965.1 V-type ATPase 116kDa subunit family protein [Bacteroidaceae bacterium]MDY4745381.1 V-type ATPase 116kDa subunit family protein [Bacteroidaceae bacterium]MDY4787228.1 V-type ATPase 116kDa subunit family protein [Bacteroidaceae bacterium]
MKKFTFLVTDKEYEGFISSLRQQGVVHVQQLQQGASSQELQQALDLESRYVAALRVLDSAAKTYQVAPHAPALGQASDSLEVLTRIENIQAEEQTLMHERDAIEKDIRVLEPWGNFDMKALQRLAQASGLTVGFFRCSSKFFRQEWADHYFAIPVNEMSKSTYFLTFSEEKPDIEAEQIFLPQESLQEKRAQLDSVLQKLDLIHGELLYIEKQLRSVLLDGQSQTRDSIQLERVHLSDERVAGDSLRLLVGWVRADRTEELTTVLDADHIFYEMEDPAFEDDVPVQITNGRFTSLFEPILRMYSLPNYHDLDPSFYFAPFFMLFFGLCLGDGGYGLLVLFGGLAVAKFCKGDVCNYGRLMAWLGMMTVICGLLMGTFFGIDLSQQDWAFLAPVKPYFLNDNGVGPIFGYSPMMVLSVIIGLIQVLLGMILKGCKAVKNYGFAYGIGTFCWVAAIILAVILYGLPACGVQLPQVVQYILMVLIGISALGIFFYNSPGSYRRPLLGLLGNIGGGVWATYGMATGLLGDLLSYIRLFALGLTGGVLGGVFNSLAIDMTSSLPVMVRWIPMILILLAGHGITFALSMISAFVHPMRLTFVEFFKNADFEGGGKEYSPFRKEYNK